MRRLDYACAQGSCLRIGGEEQILHPPGNTRLAPPTRALHSGQSPRFSPDWRTIDLRIGQDNRERPARAQQCNQ
jgi:hypothetical protein